MTYETVRLEEDSGVAIMTFNRPEKRNALSYKMSMEAQSAITQVRQSETARVLIVTGEGLAFCAGADLEELPNGANPKATKPEEIRLWLREAIQGLNLALHDLEMPTLALVNGVASGAGMDIACACDLRIGSENSRFITGYTRIGLFPGGGGTWMLPRLIGLGKALELIYSSDPIEADEAVRLGLLNFLEKPDELQNRGRVYAAKLASGAPIALRLAKANVYRGLTMDLGTALEMAAAAEVITLTSDDHREGVTALKEGRPPNFKGS